MAQYFRLDHLSSWRWVWYRYQVVCDTRHVRCRWTRVPQIPCWSSALLHSAGVNARRPTPVNHWMCGFRRSVSFCSSLDAPPGRPPLTYWYVCHCRFVTTPRSSDRRRFPSFGKLSSSSNSNTCSMLGPLFNASTAVPDVSDLICQIFLLEEIFTGYCLLLSLLAEDSSHTIITLIKKVA